MKRVIRASAYSSSDRAEFTWGDILLLLKQIKELEGLDITLSKHPNQKTEVLVGDYAYSLETDFSSYPAQQSE